MINLGKPICTNFEDALGREWLETNMLGGFACGTVAGANTRRYHGLLTAALNPPGGRALLLSKLEETLIVDGRRFDLSTNEYGDGVVHPSGFQSMVNFRLDPFPTFVFEIQGVGIEKTLFMPHESNSIQAEYRLLYAPAGVRIELELRPLIAFRDYHSTTHENPALDPHFDSTDALVSVEPYPGLPRLYLAHNAVNVSAEGYWYRDFHFRVEQERGLDSREDLFNPLVMKWKLDKWQNAVVIASTEQVDILDAGDNRSHELARRDALVEKTPVRDSFLRTLTAASDQFLAMHGQPREDNEDYTIMAGYPWFTDWGRDTMISLPGLALCTGKYNVAKKILRHFSRQVSQGMLPNRLIEAGVAQNKDKAPAPEYNTVDAALWFFEAARAYGAASGDYDFLQDELYPVLADMVDWHVRGTRYNIRMEDNGLLRAGEPGVQLTWMDAKIGDRVITPRTGRPVEIQALWYNALRTMEDLSYRFGRADDKARYAGMATLTQWSFQRLFWNKDANCLYDVMNADGTGDGAVRPNQIFAVSLPFSMLSPERSRAVVAVVERELLTPFGLRTLSPSDPNYAGRYQGDQQSRDAAYHQGTVWPWLLGPFVSAYVKINGGTKEARERGGEILRGLEPHLSEAGLGQVSEIFEGDAPHRPCGCFAQAWSVAEVLRALCQDVYQVNGADRSEHVAA